MGNLPRYGRKLQKAMKLDKENKREEMAAIGTMILITAILTAVTLSVIFNIF